MSFKEIITEIEIMNGQKASFTSTVNYSKCLFHSAQTLAMVIKPKIINNDCNLAYILFVSIKDL